MEKTKNVNQIIHEIEDPDTCTECGLMNHEICNTCEVIAKETGHRFSLRSTDEAKELISMYGCHEG